MGHLEYHIALTGIGTLPHRAHRDQHTNSEKMSDSFGHLEQEIAACMQSDEKPYEQIIERSLIVVLAGMIHERSRIAAAVLAMMIT